MTDSTEDLASFTAHSVARIEKTLEERLSEPGAVYLTPPHNTENTQWLRFAEAASVGIEAIRYFKAAMPDMAELVADFADAMLEEAKKRGRV